MSLDYFTERLHLEQWLANLRNGPIRSEHVGLAYIVGN